VSSPTPPIGDGSVPDKVLEELLAAFAGEPPKEDLGDLDAIHALDDPTIDTLLGIDSLHGMDRAPSAEIDVWRQTTGSLVKTTPNQGSDPGAADTSQVDITVAELVSEPIAAAPAPKRPPIKIGGDDQPDAVYLNEEAGERLRGSSDRATEASIRGERNTILIVGDEIEGLSGGIPLAASSASMDPRLRARRIAVRRAIGRRRLKWFLIVGIVVLVVAGSLTVLGSSLFAISHVTPSGAHRIDAATLQAAENELIGTPALLVDTRKIERTLEASPWVSKARVTVHFPHNATIELVERVPIATYVGSDNRFRIMAVDGVVVDVIPGLPVDFVLIRGSGPNVEPGSSAGETFTHAAELVQALSPTVRRLTALVNVGDNGDLSLIFHGPTASKPGTTVILGGATDLLDKLTRLEAFLQRPGTQTCSLINVSTSPISHKC
jgi:cell division septal protein FtsQ